MFFILSCFFRFVFYCSAHHSVLAMKCGALERVSALQLNRLSRLTSVSSDLDFIAYNFLSCCCCALCSFSYDFYDFIALLLHSSYCAP
jgi:hypothetical protein